MTKKSYAHIVGKNMNQLMKIHIWNGYYGNDLDLNDSDLKNPRPKEELFIDSRYEGSRW